MSSKSFLTASLVVIVAIVGYRFHQYFIAHNFPVVANVPCDPEAGTCFVLDCDPITDEECDAEPYKKIQLLSYEAPECVEEHTCGVIDCTEIASCAETYCDEESLEDGEMCYEPPVFVAEPTDTENATTTEPTLEEAVDE